MKRCSDFIGMAMKPWGRLAARLLIAGICLMAAVGTLKLWQLLATGVAYKAKVLCSGVFLSGRNPQSVLSEDLEAEDLKPLRIISTRVDRNSLRVKADFMGIIEQSAVYRPGLGCGLVFKEDTDSRLAAMPRPSSPGKAGQESPPDPKPRLKAALAWAFAEPDPEHLLKTRAVVVVKDGKIIAERYAPGFGPKMPLPGWSMAKSVANALVGILVGQGRLNLDKPAPVPEWLKMEDPRRAITLGQLMRMTPGLEFSETAENPLGDVTQMLLRTPDAAAYAANKPLAAPPGRLWHYASGNTNIISRIIRTVVGEAEYLKFPQKALFEPLGMDSAVMETDAAGNFVSSSFMYATARDWAKFGQLYLQDGIWQGKRILPEGWVGYSTTPTHQAPGRQYGAHFWLNIQEDYGPRDIENPLPADAYHAMGHEGQCVSIIPSRRLVVVRLGLTRMYSAWRQDHLVNLILEAVAD